MRTARGMKVLAAAGSLALMTAALVACGGSTEPTVTPTETGKTKVKVGLAYDIGGRGDKSFNDSAAAGLDMARENLDIETKELPATLGEPEADKLSRLLTLCQGGYNPVIAVGFAYAGPLAEAAAECPETKFAIVDSAVEAPNVTGLLFAEEQGSYLVGVAAALKSETNHVGFIGGCSIGLIAKFEAGFIAGAKSVSEDIVVDSRYISTPAEGCSGFNAPEDAAIAANGMYDAGADVVFHAAGGSGTGLFQAAAAKGKLAIGVDSDQYLTADASLQPYILTSMLKRVDVAVFTFVKDFSEDNFAAGAVTFDLEVDGVGYSESGGFLADIKTEIEAAKAAIISGSVVVPTDPANV